MITRMAAWVLAGLLLAGLYAAGQSPTSPAPQTPPQAPPSTTTPSTSTPTARTPPTMPSPMPQVDPSRQPGRGVPQSSADRVPLSGKVIMEAGGPPPESVRIETVCGSRTSVVAYTDSRGGFSTGRSAGDLSDARSGGVRAGSARGGTPGSSYGSTPTGPGCSLRAMLPGYRSTEVNLAFATGLEPMTIILHPMADVEGRTVSATTLQAPKEARAAFDKGLRAEQKAKWEDSRTQLEKAVQLYPRYAVAWAELGAVYAQREEPEKSRKAYREAIAIDPRFVTPYFKLAELAMHEHKWHEMAAVTGVLLNLNRYDFPAAYAYDAMAHLNLNDLDAAEKSAREGLKADTGGDVPKNEHLLGVILMRKRDFEGAAEHLKRYLEAAPNAPEAEFVNRQIAVCEAERLASGKR